MQSKVKFGQPPPVNAGIRINRQINLLFKFILHQLETDVEKKENAVHLFCEIGVWDVINAAYRMLHEISWLLVLL